MFTIFFFVFSCYVVRNDETIRNYRFESWPYGLESETCILCAGLCGGCGKWQFCYPNVSARAMYFVKLWCLNMRYSAETIWTHLTTLLNWKLFRLANVKFEKKKRRKKVHELNSQHTIQSTRWEKKENMIFTIRHHWQWSQIDYRREEQNAIIVHVLPVSLPILW